MASAARATTGVSAGSGEAGGSDQDPSAKQASQAFCHSDAPTMSAASRTIGVPDPLAGAAGGSLGRPSGGVSLIGAAPPGCGGEAGARRLGRGAAGTPWVEVAGTTAGL